MARIGPLGGFLIVLRKISYSNLIVLYSSGMGNLEIACSINTFIHKLLYKILIFASSFSPIILEFILKSNAILFVFMI